MEESQNAREQGAMIPDIEETQKYNSDSYIGIKEPLSLSSIVNFNDYSYVYQPNDDSYFFLDVINTDLTHKYKEQKDDSPFAFLEIGSGSGFVIANLINSLRKAGKEPGISIASDINIHACLMTQKLAAFNKLNIECVNTNIADSLLPRLKNKFDIIICNPPYVPTEKQELEQMQNYIKTQQKLLKEKKKIEFSFENNCIDASFAGGFQGMEITYQILEKIPELISENGAFYMFLIKENNIQKVNKFLLDRGLKHEFLARQKKINEIQYVYQYFQ